MTTRDATGAGGDRWARIERIFALLLDAPEDVRLRMLGAAEHSDVAGEVEALLVAHRDLTSAEGRGYAFLGRLDTSAALALLQRRDGDADAPETVGRYRIVRRLARGGMGVVYEAHDPALDRPVALKLLPASRSVDPFAIRRLTEEARTACVLDHSNIATIYEIGETGDGRVFIAMAYYEGETVRERVARGPSAVADVVELGLQLARGLDAAHRRGIVHRDVKPENLVVTTEGVLKIVDFGVATIARDGAATGGGRFGTAAYMSPEQVRGEPVDRRSDVWSAGVVLYELLTGTRPFQGEGEPLFRAILHEHPPALRKLRRDVPRALGEAVERCLEKDPDRRLDGAELLEAALRRAARDRIAPAWDGSRARLPWNRPRRILATVLVLVAALALVPLLRRSDRTFSDLPATAGAALPGIAVLPFDTRGDGLEVWREGMVDLLSSNLDGVAGLRAIDSRTVLARWRNTVAGSGAPDLPRALGIAREIGARYAVLGGVVAGGSSLRLDARVHSLQDGRNLASLQVDGPADSVLALVDRLSIDVLAAIWQRTEQPRARIDLAGITTTSVPALKSFLQGESSLRRADYEGAISAYGRAIAADSSFAFALYHLGLAYTWMPDTTGEYFRLRTEAFRRALRLAGRLPEREVRLLHAASAFYTPTREVMAIELLQEATRRYPDDADAWFLLGESAFHAGQQALIPQSESERAFRRAVELDPGFAPSYDHLIHNAFIYRPDSARAASLIATYRRLAPTSEFLRDQEVAFGLTFGDSALRRRAFAALDTLPPSSVAHVGSLFLSHPRWRLLQETVLARRPGSTDPRAGFMTALLFEGTLSRGRLAAALEHLQDPRMFAGVRLAGLYTLYAAGLLAPGAALDAALALPPTESSPTDVWLPARLFYAGAYAGDRGRWEDHSAAETRLRAHADARWAEGDSSRARFATGAAVALRGQGLWRRGDTRRALPLLTDGQRLTVWTVTTAEAVNETIRWWLGELQLELGRDREAERTFSSFWNDPFAAARLGPLRERLGDLGEARVAYGLVASAWEQADPELQKHVRDARAALDRLAGPRVQSPARDRT